MHVNVGTADRIIRFALGVIIIILGVVPAMEAWRIPLLIVGGIILLTSFLKFCLLYRLFNIDTRRRKDGMKDSVVIIPESPQE